MGLRFNNAPKFVLAVGSVSFDTVRLHPDVAVLGDRKEPAAHHYKAAGGGGANFSIALRDLSAAFGAQTNITLCTKIGEPPAEPPDAEEVRQKVLRDLSGLQIIDSVRGQTNTIPDNVVIPHGQARFISTGFNEAVIDFTPGTEALIAHAVRDTDLVFLHTRYPRQAQMAARAAVEYGKPVLLDYSVTQWPDEPVHQEALREILSSATYVVAPGEAVLDGMTADPERDEHAAELIRRIRNEHGVQAIAVSNNSHPVKVFADGRETEVIVHPVDTVIDILGVGDARNAMTALALMHGRDFKTALEMGTAVATFSVQYPGRTWLPHVGEGLSSHPLFDDRPEQDVDEPAYAPI